MKRILLIEDEKNMASFVRLELEHEHYQVTVAYDGVTGLQLALGEEWDLILLDMMLPGMDGIEVCRRVRSCKTTPILMLTARDSISDRVNGLDNGADDYLPKPFAIEELLARIRAIARRMQVHRSEHDVLQISDLQLQLSTREVRRGDRLIELTKREFDLLACLMENTNLVMTRDQLLDHVWGYNSEVETNVVDVYIRYIRNKIDEPGRNSLIQTIRGTGYVMRK
jgi:DNA-binding response OmpR family regulator